MLAGAVLPIAGYSPVEEAFLSQEPASVQIPVGDSSLASEGRLSDVAQGQLLTAPSQARYGIELLEDHKALLASTSMRGSC